MWAKSELRRTAKRVKEELGETGRVVLRSPALVGGAECLIRLLLGAVLSGATVLESAAPFGLAMVACSGPGVGGFAALLGTCFGYLVFRGFTEGLRYVAAAILVFSVSFAFYDLALCRKSWFMPAATALLSGCTGFTALSRANWSGTALALFLGELALTAAAVYFYRLAFSPWQGGEVTDETSLRQRVSALILVCTVLIALTPLTGPAEISLGRLCACLALMAAAWRGGVGLGAAVGVAVGLSMDLAAGGAPYYTMAYGFAGLFTGVFWKQGRLSAALAYVLSNATAMLWSWDAGARLNLLYEVFMASVLFLILPESLLRRAGGLLTAHSQPQTADPARHAARERLAETAAAFRELGGCLKNAFRPPVPNREDPSVIFDRAAERVCRRCALRDSCWRMEYETTKAALNDALARLLDRGRGTAADFPEHFRSRCVRFPDFLSAANEETAALLTRRQFQSRLGESRRAVCAQYDQLAHILEETAAELGAPLTPDRGRTRALGQYLAELELEGDGVVFYDHRGRLQAMAEGRGFDLLAKAPHPARLAGRLSVTLQAPSLHHTSRGTRVIFRQTEPLSAVTGAAGRQKEGQTVSGDAGAWFKNEEGILYVLLCDGMGSGQGARRESALAIRLLEKFLRAGVEPEGALKTLSSALALRGEAEGGFTTIDLLCLDLFTGRGTVYKYGAAPTYLRKGAGVTRLAGTSFPAGLEPGGPSPDLVKFQLVPGDCVVLLSDGVLAGEDGWLRAELGEWAGSDPKDLAHALVNHPKGPAGQDDKTAVVIQLRAN